jgi:hypothetical protein
LTRKLCKSHAGGGNSSGVILGFYTNGSGTHGFLYSGGNFTDLDDPLAAGITERVRSRSKTRIDSAKGG